MRIAFVPDGGPKTGLGHVGRCVAIAQSVARTARAKPVFVNADPACRAWIRGRGFQAVPSFRGRWDLVVLDTYLRGRRDIAAIRRNADVLAVIDDRGVVPSGADWIINTTVIADTFSYRPGAGLLLGPRFHPLRREFLAGKRAASRRSSVRNIVISLGGSAGAPVLSGLVRAVRAEFDGRIDVIVGPHFSGGVTADAKVRVHRSPKKLRVLLSKAGVAVSAAGQTLFELAYLGVPTLAVEIASNQRANIRGFAKAGTVVPLGRLGGAGFESTLRTSLRSLLKNPAKRARMSAAGRALVDGRGGDRLAKALVS